MQSHRERLPYRFFLRSGLEGIPAACSDNGVRQPFLAVTKETWKVLSG